MGTASSPGKSSTFQRLCVRVALPLALARRMGVTEALEQQRFRAYNRTTLLAGVAEAASASGDDVKRFWPFALRHFVTPVAGYYLCDRYVGDEVERYGLPPPVGARLELMAAAAAAVAPFASVYVQARYVEAFAASVVPHLRAPIVLVTGSEELPQVEASNWTEALLEDRRIAFWFSQNPVYSGRARYGGFPYGVRTETVLGFAKALVRSGDGPRRPGLQLTYTSRHRMNGWMRAGLPNGPRLPVHAFYDLLATASFVLSPCGDRCDTYRTYEAIGLGAVPVVNAPEALYSPGLLAGSAVFFDSAHPERAEAMRRGGTLPPYAEPDRGLVQLDAWRERIAAAAAAARAGAAVPAPAPAAAAPAPPRRVPYKAELGWWHFEHPRRRLGGTGSCYPACWGLGNEVVYQCKFGRIGCQNPRNWPTIDEYAAGWRLLAPFMKRFLASQNATANVTYARTAVVHFRCSDVPFSRHDEYFLLPRRYFDRVRQWLGARRSDWDSIVILSCPELPAAGAPASPLAAARCGDFVDVIAGWLGGAATICKRDSAVALGAMLGAAALVSTGGSFSFAAGVARGDGAFFAPSLAGVGDFPEAARLAAAVPWASTGTHDRLGHGCVDDYATFDYAAAPADGCASASDRGWMPSRKYRCALTEEARMVARRGSAPALAPAATPAAPAPPPGSRVVATGASKSHAWHLAEFAKQFHSLRSGVHLVVYDLGLGPTAGGARRAVEAGGGEFRTMPWDALPAWMAVEGGPRYAGEYAFKPWIVARLLDEFESVLWLDAGNRVGDAAALDAVFANITARGLWTTSSGPSLARWVHPGMAARLGASAFVRDRGDALMCNGAFVGFSRASPTYEQVFRPWFACSMDLGCLAPPGADRANHRQDQSALSVLAYQHGLGDLCNRTATPLVGKRQPIWGHFFDKEFDRWPPAKKAAYLDRSAKDPYCARFGCRRRR